MSTMIAFTRNYEDLSTDRGYQFKFHCDKCGNGFMSPFEASVVGTAGSLLRAAGDLFGGFLSNAGSSAYEVQRAVGGKAHDEALLRAVEEGKKHFHQCSRCGRWVCPEVCWNAQAGQCEECAPNFQEETAAAHAQAKAEAMRSQMHDAARQQNYVGGIDMSAGATMNAANAPGARAAPQAAAAPGGAMCGACGAAMGSAKFCPQCGAPRAAPGCPKCGSALAAGTKFCGECGHKV
jgi:hypothetical protein